MKKSSYSLKDVQEFTRKRGFTLVELVVAITVLGILSAMAVVSYSNYAKSSRDTSRKDTITMLSKLLEEYASSKGSYPVPDDYKDITYSGNVFWKQGVVGDGVTLALRITSKPVDPLYNANYAYSITSNNTQYELAAVLETAPKLSYGSLASTAYAQGEYIRFTLLNGTYNKLFVLARTETGNLLVTSPSITLSDLSITEITNPLFNSGTIVLDKRSNIPDSYKNTLLKRSGDIYFKPKFVGSFSGQTVPDDSFSDIMLATKQAYSGTIFESSPNVGGNTLWRDFLSSTGGSEREASIGRSALESLIRGSFSFPGNTGNYSSSGSVGGSGNYCSGTIYSGSLYSSYNITPLRYGESKVFNEYVDVLNSNREFVGVRVYSIEATCANGRLIYSNETKNVRITRCPSGFIPVPGNPTFNTTDFCVAKYEMTYEDNLELNTSNTGWATLQYNSTKTPASVGGNYPIANLTQQQAIDQCRSMGPGYHLITNNEWMTIARNIESVADNWSGGAVGAGGVYRGISGESNTTTSLGCATSNSTGLKPRTYVAGTLTTDTNLWGSSKSNNCDSKRQHKLSNGSIIWDFAGNVREHVDRGNNPNTTTANVGEGNLCGGEGYWHSSSGPASVCGEQYGPIHRGGGIDIGMGYVSNSSGNDKIFLRGGGADSGGSVGIFTSYLARTASNTDPHVGFRCAFSY